MSYYPDGHSPGSYSPSGQYQYPYAAYAYATPGQHSYPPHPPPLPGSAVPPVVHHHGVGSHGSTSPEDGSAKGNAQAEPKGEGDDGESGKTAGEYATPTTVNPHYYYGSQAYVHVLPESALQAPYYGPAPPLPPVPASKVSPGDLGAESAAAVYRHSPYYSDAPNLGAGSGSSESTASSGAASAGGRPVPARSAFMCFSQAKGKEIAQRAGAEGKVSRLDCSRVSSVQRRPSEAYQQGLLSSQGGFVEAVANEWRNLTEHERSYWDGQATKEKGRFKREAEAYKGPLARKLRAKKNPLAPKRPMSAFLMYAQVKRRVLQKENPGMLNADISRLLGEVWRGASAAEKRPFLEREEVERQIYKAKMASFKADERLAKAVQKEAKASTAATAAAGATKGVGVRQDEEPAPLCGYHGENAFGVLCFALVRRNRADSSLLAFRSCARRRGGLRAPALRRLR